MLMFISSSLKYALEIRLANLYAVRISLGNIYEYLIREEFKT